jgi:hypothetical protein
MTFRNEGVTTYTQEFTGFFVPPVTAQYAFYVVGDDTVDVYISANSSAAPGAMTRIAGLTAASDARGFFTRAGQISSPRTLLASQRYYFQVRHTQNTGNDYFSLGMRIYTQV